MNTRPLVTAIVAVVALVCALDPSLAEELEWRRAGALWRVATGHLAHYGWSHAAYDLVAWLALGVLCEREARGAMVVALVAAAVAIPAAVAWLEPSIHAYRGLSGLDSALFGLAVTTRLRRTRAWPWAALGALFVAKLAVEAHGGAVFVDAGAARVVPLAHAVGLAAGALVALAAPKSAATTARSRDVRRLPGQTPVRTLGAHTRSRRTSDDHLDPAFARARRRRDRRPRRLARRRPVLR